MNLPEILEKAAAEKTYPSRFPVRLIFVNSLQQYCTLVSRLEGSCVPLNIGDFCSGQDTRPNFDKLSRRLEQESGLVLLLSVSEYLRLAGPDDPHFASFWSQQQEASSMRRILVPLYDSRALFDRLIPFVDPRQKDYLWTLEDDFTDSFSLKLYSPEFERSGDTVVHGIKQWLYEWHTRINDPRTILISRFAYTAGSIQGKLSIETITDPFNLVRSSLSDGAEINQQWGSVNQWIYLSNLIQPNDTLSSLISRQLNVLNWRPLDILAKWKACTPEEKWLIWLWYQRNPSNDYYSFVFRTTDSIDRIENTFRSAILREGYRNEDWIRQRESAMDILQISCDDDQFLKALSEIPLPEIRLKLLSCASLREKAFAIRTISEMLQKGADLGESVSLVEKKYPQLFTYMTHGLQDPADSYFGTYRRYKLLNHIPEDLNCDSVDLNSYPSRYSCLNDWVNDSGTYAIWVDGMGAEWLPLLLKSIQAQHPDASVQQSIAAALLPTETEYNNQWQTLDMPFKKYSELDQINHKGVMDEKDYYACIARQFEIIEKMAGLAVEALQEHNHVIITADHGSSRLAALAFHKQYGLYPPTHAVVKSHGRYCELKENCGIADMAPDSEFAERDGEKFLVMKTHAHFTQSGNASGTNTDNIASAGEIHGGKTPEEYLVPFVILSRRHPLKLNFFTLEQTDFTRRHCSISVHLTQPAAVLTAESENGDSGTCRQISEKEWVVEFTGLSKGSHTLALTADGKHLKQSGIFEIRSKGITENDAFSL